MAGCNLHLFRGVAPSALIYSHDAVMAGQWYRILTHSLVHVSWYHLLLDGSCTVVLLRTMDIPAPVKIGAALFCQLSSLLFSVLFSPLIRLTGFCGLSGIGHGLMFMAGILWLFPKKQEQPGGRGARIFGGLFCLLSLAKSFAELYTGDLFLLSSHQGYLGTPIIHAHAGGVIGGGAAALVMRWMDRKKTAIPVDKLRSQPY